MGWTELIVIGAEGGSITLYGLEITPNKWVYSLERDETTLQDFLNNEDVEMLEQNLFHKTNVVESWEKAIKLLGQYPWFHLSPRYVHPDFRKKVWEIIQQKRPESMNRWERRLFPK